MTISGDTQLDVESGMIWIGDAIKIGAMDRHHPAPPIAISGTIREMWIDAHLRA